MLSPEKHAAKLARKRARHRERYRNEPAFRANENRKCREWRRDKVAKCPEYRRVMTLRTWRVQLADRIEKYEARIEATRNKLLTIGLELGKLERKLRLRR